MEPVLFDTTVWIDYLNGVSSAQTDLLDRYIADNEPVLVCPTIVQEVLQGIRNQRQFEETRESLMGFPCLNLPGLEAALQAAGLYRALRQQGVTVRKANDCLIAAYALHFEVPICHNDRDFTRLVQHTNLREVTH